MLVPVCKGISRASLGKKGRENGNRKEINERTEDKKEGATVLGMMSLLTSGVMFQEEDVVSHRR